MGSLNYRAHIFIDHTLDLRLNLVKTSESSLTRVTTTPHVAAAVGIKVGDYIQSLNGVRLFPTISLEEVEAKIVNSPRPLTITVVRNGGFPTAHNPEPEVSFEWDVLFQSERAGIVIAEKEKAGISEVVIVDVKPPASNSGVLVGDIILSVNGAHIEAGTHHFTVAQQIASSLLGERHQVQITFFRPSPMSVMLESERSATSSVVFGDMFSSPPSFLNLSEYSLTPNLTDLPASNSGIFSNDSTERHESENSFAQLASLSNETVASFAAYSNELWDQCSLRTDIDAFLAGLMKLPEITDRWMKNMTS